MRLRLHDPPRTRRFRGRQAACQAGCGHQDVARRIPRPLRLPRRPEVKINLANGGGKIPAAVFFERAHHSESKMSVYAKNGNGIEFAGSELGLDRKGNVWRTDNELEVKTFFSRRKMCPTQK